LTPIRAMRFDNKTSSEPPDGGSVSLDRHRHPWLCGSRMILRPAITAKIILSVEPVKPNFSGENIPGPGSARR
jgi:hypothetical protein